MLASTIKWIQTINLHSKRTFNFKATITNMNKIYRIYWMAFRIILKFETEMHNVTDLWLFQLPDLHIARSLSLPLSLSLIRFLSPFSEKKSNKHGKMPQCVLIEQIKRYRTMWDSAHIHRTFSAISHSGTNHTNIYIFPVLYT